MLTLENQKLGGKIMAIRIRKTALDNYYKNPNYCQYCEKMITVPENAKVNAIKAKKFCNCSCAASFNNRSKPKRTKIIKLCLDCNKIIKRFKNNIYFKEPYCKQCFVLRTWSTKKKCELFASRKNWQSARNGIRRHAVIIYRSSNKPQICLICGYDDWRVLEVAHRKAVSKFGNDCLISEINHLDNLEAMCPTHHTEFDKGLRLLT